MKPLLFISTLLCAAYLAVGAHAQQQPATVEDMQKMMNSPEFKQQMEQAKKMMQQQGIDTSQFDQQVATTTAPANLGALTDMSNCVMDGVGEDGMKRMQQQGMVFEKKIAALCKAGKTKEAEAQAYAFGKKMQSSKEGKAMQACRDKYGKKLDKQMDDFNKQYGFMGDDERDSKDICDGY